MTISFVRRVGVSRRAFLRGSGVALSLPILDAMFPVFTSAAELPKAPRRFVAMCATLGFHKPFLIPKESGPKYTLPPYLQELKDHKNDFTVLSGLSHPEQSGANGHSSELTWLTAARRPGLAGFKNSISLDQLFAEKVGVQTRYPYLALTTRSESMSWTANGVSIPGEDSPARLFQQLFVTGTATEMKAQVRRLQRGQSILDTVAGQAKKMERELGPKDQEKLEEYLTAVRGLEVRLQESEGWVHKPKPQVTVAPPTDIQDRNDAIGKARLMYEMIALALQTDSTRNITFRLAGMNAVPVVEGVKSDWHNLSHHGQDETKIEELKLIEQAEFAAFGEFLSRLKSTTEQGQSLLDNTNVLFGSNLGNASAHDWRNLPIVLAGGGFKHGQHLAYDANNNTPFCNLFVAIAQQMGLEIEQFGSSTAAGVRGLEAKS